MLSLSPQEIEKAESERNRREADSEEITNAKTAKNRVKR